ncbi:HAMP domain-containing histidine kinase [Clostridium sp. P21]|uniref:histidine kinase n=1 Tax=Clostridium muellerianum TaxID=2716538 RepID=A0A7Y0EFH8_9CLOT|nr:HAMP domain-containing sensor histidine kinase [Clostridium muellerianum]NMM62554.1 HAMP domain-containing histidine kinase [Clostridium muellerianum]
MKKVSNLVKGKSLRWKLVSRFILILVLLFIIMEIFQYVTLEQYLYGSKEQILDARFHNMDIKTLKSIKTSKDVIENANKLINMTVDTNMGAAVIDVNGNCIASSTVQVGNNRHNSNDSLDLGRRRGEPVSNPLLSQNEYKDLLKQKGTLEGYRLVKDENGNLQIVGFRKIGNINSPLGIIQLSLSASPIQDLIYRQAYIYIVASILVLIIGAIIGGKVFKYTLNPLYKMTDTVEYIDVEQLNMRLPIDNGQIEIDSLSIAFNNMLQRIESSFNKEQEIKEQMRQFLSDASHELRTPLTSIHGFVEVLLRGAAKDEKKLDLALNSILMESERLSKLVNDLLMLNRLDQHISQKMNIEDLSDIVKEISSQLNILANKRNIKFNLKENINVIADRNQIKQVIFNLVQNAVRHTDEKKGEIVITVDRVLNFSEGYAIISVKDNGTGISKEYINKIFDRFFRIESHRARAQGGYGLGLSIVKSIVDAHNGKIEIDSEPGKGTTFSVYIKLKD